MKKAVSWQYKEKLPFGHAVSKWVSKLKMHIFLTYSISTHSFEDILDKHMQLNLQENIIGLVKTENKIKK